jgi:hypothetical protein
MLPTNHEKFNSFSIHADWNCANQIHRRAFSGEKRDYSAFNEVEEKKDSKTCSHIAIKCALDSQRDQNIGKYGGGE